MTDITLRDEWRNPAHPPVPEATDLGGGVWVSWTSPFNRPGEPLIWHWYNRSVARATSQDKRVQPWWLEERWLAAGVQDHTLVSRDPLTLAPSLLLSDCCGLHGFIENGRWRSV